MNTKFLSAATFTGLLLTPLLAFADFNAPPPPNILTVSVSDHCTVIDTDTVSHTYSGGYFGICALQQAIDDAKVSGVSFSNQFPSFGLFVTSVNGVAANPNSEYWALYQNGSFATLGLSQLPVAAGDILKLELHDFSDNPLGSELTLSISSLVSSAPASSGSSGAGGTTLHNPFDVPLAVFYLGKQQGENGSFGAPLLDDWVAIMTAAGKAGDIRARLISYFSAHTPSLSLVTDYERHAMALMALGINPYDGSSVDTITPIVKSFDGEQIGDKTLVNDDIFGVIVLLHAGYEPSENIIGQTVAFIRSQQLSNGSWYDSVDLTAAAIQALQLARSLPGVPETLKQATDYLHSRQADDGGFGNAASTSWALQGIWALKDSVYNWSNGTYRTPEYYLATTQDIDGGVGTPKTNVQTRVWETTYAIPAVLHKTWDELLQSFPKPEPKSAVQTIATSSTLAASTTAPVSTMVATGTSGDTVSASTDTATGTETGAATSSLSQAAGAGSVDWDQLFLLFPFLFFLLFALMRFLKWRSR